MTSSEQTGSRQRFAVLLFGIYKRAVSPVLHGIGISQCKFLPTCSDYALVAVTKHGWMRGGWLAARRVARCRPFAKGGLDPVP